MTLDIGKRVGVALPQVSPTDPAVSLTEVLDVARWAESVGVHSVWTQEQLIGSASVHDPIVLLSTAAVVTSSVQLGVSVLPLPQFNPVLLAKQLASLDALSDGRLLLGLGLGARDLMPITAGFPSDRLAERFDASLAVMRELWSSDMATIHRPPWTLDGATINPKPVRRPGPPIWFGGHHPNALARALAHGDGWMGAGAMTLETYLDCVRTIRMLEARDGSEPGAFPVAKRFYVAIEDGSGRNMGRSRAWFSAYSGKPEQAATALLHGSPGEIAESILSLVKQDVLDLVLINPLFDFIDTVSSICDELVARSSPVNAYQTHGVDALPDPRRAGA